MRSEVNRGQMNDTVVRYLQAHPELRQRSGVDLAEEGQYYTFRSQADWGALLSARRIGIGADRQPIAAPWEGSCRLWSLWDMLESYFPIYQLAIQLQALRSKAEIWKRTSSTGYTLGQANKIAREDAEQWDSVLEAVHQKCLDYGFEHTAEMAKRLVNKGEAGSYSEMFSALDYLSHSLCHELEKD